MKHQLRAFEGTQLKVSAGRTVVGTAIPYNSLSRNLGGFVERFMPGSVTDQIKSGEIQALLNHNRDQIVGTQKAQTLRLMDTANGLAYENDLPETSYGNDAHVLIQRGDGTGTSFGFACDCFVKGAGGECRWVKENGQNVHEVRKVGLLHEISILTGPPPAYAATSFSLRSADELKATADEYGIDFDGLASVFLSIKRGLPLTDAETEVMQQARCLFAEVRKPLLEAAEKKAASMLF